MSRPLSLKMARAMRAGRPMAIFASIDHPSGTAYYWTGIGFQTWNGHTWTGIGNLGAITPVKQSSDVSIQEINFVLSGIDATLLSLLSDDVRNRSGQAWLACLDEKEQVIANPYQFIDSQLDYQTLSVNADGTATISITARMGFYTLERAIEEAWTPQNQKFTYPTDTGLDMIPGLQHQDVQWKPS